MKSFASFSTSLLLGIVITAMVTQAVAKDTKQPFPQGKQSLQYNGDKRSYIVRVPTAVTSKVHANANARVAVVLVLHGGGGDGGNAEKMTGFTDKAEREGFIVVYPEGTGRRIGSFYTWNAGHCCGPAMEKHVDDVNYISLLIDTLLNNYPIDPDRVFVTGMSNGAMMTHRLGIELSDKIAAIAPVVGTVFGDELQPKSAVSALMINGLLDKSVPYAGGITEGRFADSWDGTPTQPAREQATFWAAANHCATEPTEVDDQTQTLVRYRCSPGLDVELHIIKDNGHAWPGGKKGSRRGDTPSTVINATDVIWEFFTAHPKVS